MRHLNSLFPLTTRFRTWLTSFQPGMLHGVTGNPKSHSIFPPRPILREGKRYSECSTVCIFSLQFPPCFPESRKEIPDPISFLLPTTPEPYHSSDLGCSKPAGKEKRPSDSHAGWRGGSWRGPRSLRGSCVWASRNLAFGVRLPAARVRQRRCQERPRGRAESAGGPILSCCSAPAGRRKPVLLSSGEEPSLKANSVIFPLIRFIRG